MKLSISEVRKTMPIRPRKNDAAAAAHLARHLALALSRLRPGLRVFSIKVIVNGMAEPDIAGNFLV
jgi:hypothetical protein